MQKQLWFSLPLLPFFPCSNSALDFPRPVMRIIIPVKGNPVLERSTSVRQPNPILICLNYRFLLQQSLSSPCPPSLSL